MLLYKEEGFAKVQSTVELAQTVLANTAPTGHDAINQALAKLQEEWSSLASRMVEIKVDILFLYIIIININTSLN